MSITPEQIQWAAYYVNLQSQGQQLTPDQAQWANWYRQNYPAGAPPPGGPPPSTGGGKDKKDKKDKGKKDKDKDKKDKKKDKKAAAPAAAYPPGYAAYPGYAPGGFPGGPPGTGAPLPAAKPLAPADQAKASPAFNRLKTMDAKKLLIAAYEIVPQLQTKLQTITKNPQFKVVYELSNFGHPPHPKMAEMYRTSGYTYNDDFYKTQIPTNVYDATVRMLGWLGSFEHQFLTPLLSGFQQFYNDATNASCLNGVINTLEVRHAAAEDDTESHWEILGNTLTYMVNCHSTEHHNRGKPLEPMAVWGTYVYVLEKVAALGTPPTTVVKLTPGGEPL